MNQQKKNSIVAQASSNLNTEAAIKFLPLASSKDGVKSGGPTDKDGFDPGGTEVLQFIVDIALNGFLITIVYIDQEIPDEKYIAETMDEVSELMKSKF